MKIPKLFKKAAAFVMAAVTALSIMPATAFAAGDIGTISFSHTYDSNGNAMRYNSSANIGGYTAGGTGNYKYRMFVDGENAFCIQPGVPLKTGNTLKKASSDTWNALSANQKKAVGLALLYGYQGNRNNLSGSDDEKWLATQTLVWEFVTGCREATGSYNQTSTTVYSLHFGSNYANSGARAVYDQIVAMLREHNTIPSFMSGGKNDITKELAYKDGKYSITLTDSNGVLSDYSFSSSDSNVSVSKSGNKLTISSTVAISGSVRITAKRNNVPTVSNSAKLIAYGDPNLQDLVTGVENADTVSAYINIETPTGTIALKKTSEDGVVEGISFTIKGDNFNKTVKTGKDGSVSVEGLFPGTYTVTEQSIDRYEPQKTQTVTLIGGKTSTVTFSNTLKRGSLEIVKTSEDNLVEGMKFHLYGTSLSGLPVDEYTADSKEQLDNDTEALLTTARKHLCQFAVLKYQQMDGLNTALPFGVRKIDALRTLTTESLAVFIPFRVQEIYHENGVYYGQNVISKNMIIANRRQLLNGNSFILGVSGAGKSFTAKEEMTNIILTDPNADIIIIDPEREYSPLVKAKQGEVIHISATSENHINAMDMNSDYGDGANPVILKSEFILSLCEQLIGGTNLGAKQKSIIDRCTASVYRYYQQGNYMGTPPTLQDFREELLKQNEPEAQEIALAIELFTDGSLNTFAKHTNVDTHSRLICYDILDLGKQLQPIGMLVVLDSILNRITQNRAKGRNTFIFIDEIYLLFQHEYSANFLFTLWKRVRKYGAYCTGITQNVDDLLQSHTARTMLANSEFIIMLNQASTDRLELAKLLNISDLQMSYITNVGAGQGLLKVGSSLVPFVNKFPRNTELYKLMTTKFGEV